MHNMYVYIYICIFRFKDIKSKGLYIVFTFEWSYFRCSFFNTLICYYLVGNNWKIYKVQGNIYTGFLFK